MQDAVSAAFSGDPEKAFGLAESALTGIGFRIGERTARSVEFIGPGMKSTRQSALLGASRIVVRSSHGELALEADLGGVASMSRFVLLFPIGLVLCLGAVLSAVYAVQFGPGMWIGGLAAIIGVNTVVWLVLGPLMARSIRLRTCRALDALLANMASVGALADAGVAAG